MNLRVQMHKILRKLVQNLSLARDIIMIQSQNVFSLAQKTSYLQSSTRRFQFIAVQVQPYRYAGTAVVGMQVLCTWVATLQPCTRHTYMRCSRKKEFCCK